MAEIEMPSPKDIIQDVKKEEILHEEINLPTDIPFSPEEYNPNDNGDSNVESPREKSMGISSEIGSDENNDLKCQEVLMDKDEVEMGAEVEVGAEPPRKRGRGRPRGSTSQHKNNHLKKPASIRSSPRYDSTETRNFNMSPRQSCPDIIAHTVASPQVLTSTPPSVKRGRGRPPKVKVPPPFPDDHVAQLNHLNNLNEVMNSPLLSQGAHNLMLTPHQLLLQQHQLYEQTRRLIQQQQMLLTQHQQVAMLAGSQVPLSPPLLMPHTEITSASALLTPSTDSGAGVKRGRGRPRGSSSKPPKLPKVKSVLNADGTPRQKRPYKKRQPKSDGEESFKMKRKYTRKVKGGDSLGSNRSSVEHGSTPVVKEKGKRGRKPKNQSGNIVQGEDKVVVKKERKQRERKPREKKPRKDKGSHLPTPIPLENRDSDGGSSTDSVVFCSEEPPPPIMSSPTYNPNSSSSNNSRHNSSNNNNRKASDRSRNATSNLDKNPSLPSEESGKHKKNTSSPVISRLEDSSSDSSSGSSSSDETGSSSSDDDSSSSSSDGGNDSSSRGSKSPSPVSKKNLGGDLRSPPEPNADEGMPNDAANGEYKHRSAESPSWWYTSQHNESGDTDSDGEDQYRQYNSNSPPPRSPSSASSESPDKSYQCHVCRKWFSSPVTLRIHKRSHQVKPNSGGSSSGGRAPRRYECDCCDATFTRRERLEQHRSEKHRGTLTERCEVCGRGFEDEEQQKKHLATHTPDERAGRCSECGATYSSWEQLRRHRSTHTPPASYVCNLCRKSFTYSHSLTRHLSNHSKAVYRCVVCKMSFNDYDSLAQHLNSHLDRYKQLKTS